MSDLQKELDMTKKSASVDFEDGIRIDPNDGAISVNLSDVSEDGDFPVIPRGVYDAVVESVEFGHSKNSGNPMWTWRLTITEGEYTKRMLFYHTVFNAGGIGRVKKALAVLGMTHLLQKEFNPSDLDILDELIGSNCQIRVDVGTYQDKPNNNVKGLLQASAGGSGDFV